MIQIVRFSTMICKEKLLAVRPAGVLLCKTGRLN